MIMNLVLAVLGAAFLLKGSDILVSSSSKIARRLGVSEFVIGLTLVAIGTSIPEFASSIAASLRQQSDIVMGTLLGANVNNIGLIIGLAAALSMLKGSDVMLRRDGYVMVFASVVVCIFVLDGALTFLEGIVLILLEVAYLSYLFDSKSRAETANHFGEFIRFFLRFEYVKKEGSRISSILGRRKGHARNADQPPDENLCLDCNTRKEAAAFAVGITGIVFGASMLVDQVIFFAVAFNVPEILIALVIVSVGTSLPELSVTVPAARRGYYDVALGNIIGSNLARLFLILGLSATISPLSVTPYTVFFVAPFMVLISVLMLVFIRSGCRIVRNEGIALLALYAIFLVLSVTLIHN